MDFEGVKKKVGYIIFVFGGVGFMIVVMFMKNIIIVVKKVLRLEELEVFKFK